MSLRGGSKGFFLFIILIFGAGTIFVVTKLGVRAIFRWLEKKYFAYLGDQGGLITVKFGRWEEIGRGLWIQERIFKRRRHWSRITLKVVRFRPEYYSVGLYWGEPKFASQIVAMKGVTAAINGGPFLPNRKPWGLFVSFGRKVVGNLISRKYDGLCLIRDGRISLELARKWSGSLDRGLSLFQSSPMLVYESSGVSLPPRPWRVDRRSAICIDHSGFVLFFTTLEKFNGLSYYELRRLMLFSRVKGGFYCRWALNLDGGSSSQMGVRMGGKLWVVDGQKPSPIFLVLRPAVGSEVRDNTSKK